MKDIYLYVHIPYCYRKCSYCAFVSYEKMLKSKDWYIESIKKEIGSFDKHFNVKTIYFGGGTPSILKSQYIGDIIESVNKKFPVSKNVEITLEANPQGLTPNYLSDLRDLGINRLSLGVQSFNDKKLSFLGRTHKEKDNIRAIKNAINIGFENINLDIMYGACENVLELETDLNKATSFPVTHISCYMLTPEKNTSFYNMIKNNKISIPDDETISEMYIMLTDYLNSKGFSQYEISNFAKNGYRSEHNSAYWLGYSYKGFGVSASSFINNTRFKNTNSIDTYIKAITLNQKPLEFEEKLNKEQRMREAFVLFLRTSDGVYINNFNKTFDIDIEKYYHKALKKLIEYDLVRNKNGKIFLNGPKAMLISNQIFVEFI